jgi:hypothetical protein
MRNNRPSLRTGAVPQLSSSWGCPSTILHGVPDNILPRAHCAKEAISGSERGFFIEQNGVNRNDVGSEGSALIGLNKPLDKLDNNKFDFAEISKSQRSNNRSGGRQYKRYPSHVSPLNAPKTRTSGVSSC